MFDADRSEFSLKKLTLLEFMDEDDPWLLDQEERVATFPRLTQTSSEGQKVSLVVRKV